jgi:integrase
MATYRKRGDKWHIQIRRTGHPNLTKTFDRKIDADRWVRRTERQIDVGELLISDPSILKKTSLACILTKYSDLISTSKRGSGPEQYRLDAISRSWLGSYKLDRLTPQAICKYRDERLKQCQSSSVLKELQLLKNVFHVARTDWGVPITHDPMAGVNLPSSAKPRNRRLEDGELDLLMSHCTHPMLSNVILFAIETGMRRGEIVASRWSNVDLTKQTLHIPDTKNGHPRTIPLTNRAVDIINNVRHEIGSDNDSIFPISGNAIRLAWERLKKRVGIVDLRFHDLRHEAVSRFFEMGLSVPEVALISGHRDPRMLFRYTHLRAEDVGKKLRS